MNNVDNIRLEQYRQIKKETQIHHQKLKAV